MFHPQLKKGLCTEQNILGYGLNLPHFRCWQRQTNLYPHTPPAELVYQTKYSFVFNVIKAIHMINI